MAPIQIAKNPDIALLIGDDEDEVELHVSSTVLKNIHFFKGELDKHYPTGQKWIDHQTSNTPTLFVMRYPDYEPQPMRLLLATLHDRKDLLHRLIHKPSGDVDWDTVYTFLEYADFFLCIDPKETQQVVRPVFSILHPFHYPKFLDIAHQYKFADFFAEITDYIAKFRAMNNRSFRC